jgi:parallel beta-helix repeat protein
MPRDPRADALAFRFMTKQWLGGASLLLSALALGGCNNLPEGCDYYVEPSSDDQSEIQLAFVSAQNGDTVCLGPGTFELTATLSVANLADFTLRGDGRDTTILNFAGQADANGHGVQMMGMTNLVVSDLSIVDTKANGLYIHGESDGVLVRNVSVGWTNEASTTNGKYAIYPVLSSNVIVEDSHTYGASDAGFYVGQVENCIVRRNTATGNVAAYEIENSTNCEMTDNVAEGNVGGFLVFELPIPDGRRGSGTLVANNTTSNNNVPNFAEGGTIVGNLPTGTGIFVLAANDLEITGNTINDNRGTGVAVVSYATVQALPTGPGTAPLPPEYDPWAENVWVHDNTFSNNGDMPGGDPPNIADPLHISMTFLDMNGVDVSGGLEDILWDGFLEEGATPGDVFCFGANGDASFRNVDIVGNFESSTTDPAPHACQGTPRPPVDL